ncbi:hypothetical protein [Halopelagius fulvigenes]|uniref:Uncharacterized protein n=1 Tax=Halopelagius fulvigenes TaxID=1198324 RepID=A0ABD5U321_9EURY
MTGVIRELSRGARLSPLPDGNTNGSVEVASESLLVCCFDERGERRVGVGHPEDGTQTEQSLTDN